MILDADTASLTDQLEIVKLIIRVYEHMYDIDAIDEDEFDEYCRIPLIEYLKGDIETDIASNTKSNIAEYVEEIDYELDNLYDLCDVRGVWIGL